MIPEESRSAGHVLMLLMDPFEHDARVEKEARTLLRAGFQVTVLAWNRFGTSRASEVRDGIRIERAPVLSPRGSKWRMVYRLPRVLAWMARRAGALSHDSLVCHELYTWPVGWLLRWLGRGRPVIFDAHEPYAEQILGILPHSAPLRRLLVWCEALLARSADVLVTVSPLMVERYRRMGVRKIFYLPNVPQIRSEWRSPATRTRSASEGPYVLGRIGVISPRYSGVEPLIELVAELNAQGTPTHLVLAGPVMNGWEPDFRRMVDAHARYVRFIGSVPTREVPKYLATFDLVANLFEPLQPKAEYGYSTKLLDAMAAAVPVITSRTAEDQYLIAEVGCGLIVNYPFNIPRMAGEVAALLRDRARREIYARRGVAAVQRKFNWAVYEQDYVGLFRSSPGSTAPCRSATRFEEGR